MSEGYLTTHVLDTGLGRPAAGLKILLRRHTGDGYDTIKTMVTNADGRTDAPILPKDEFAFGTYVLHFYAGDYLRATGQIGEGAHFLEEIPIRFGLTEEDHYHVPLLLSPFGYSTYRGS